MIALYGILFLITLNMIGYPILSWHRRRSGARKTGKGASALSGASYDANPYY